MKKITKEQIADAAKYTAFAQSLKYKLWSASLARGYNSNGDVGLLPKEEILNQIATELFNRFLAPKKKK